MTTEALLSQLGGCGMFQVLLFLVLGVASIPLAFTYLVMTFGMYNPGWRCADDLGLDLNATDGGGLKYSNSTLSSTLNLYTTTDVGTTEYLNSSSPQSNESTPVPYTMGSCKAFDSCKDVEFNPAAFTIVTEWGLACNSAWVISTILSIQMAGNLLGTLFVGYIGDRFGRRLPYHVCCGIVAGLNIISYFSVSWQMYATLLFIMGFFGAFSMLSYVLVTEYVVEKWRVRMNSLPIWTINSMIFAVTAMLTGDWKMLRMTAGVLGVVAVGLLFWLPKSLRWLSVRGKQEEALKVVKKIARVNRVKLPADKSFNSLLQDIGIDRKETKSYTFFHLFKKGYARSAIVFGVICLAIDLTYFAFSFGVSRMPGNFYTNLMIFTVADIPANILGFFVANLYNRKPSAFVFILLDALCLFAVVALDFTTTGAVREITIQVLVLTSKVCLYVGWIILYTSALEIYPTVIRSTVNSYIALCANVGSVIAPYLIPADPKVFWICYLIMALLNFGSAFLIILLPETKGKPLKDRWEDGDHENNTTPHTPRDHKDDVEMDHVTSASLKEKEAAGQV